MVVIVRRGWVFLRLRKDHEMRGRNLKWETGIITVYIISCTEKEKLNKYLNSLCKLTQIRGSIKNRKTVWLSIIYFSMNHRYQINLWSATYFFDMWSFTPFDEKIFVLPDFKINMVCHQGAQKRSKHDIKMMHARLIVIPLLYITHSLYNMTSYLLIFVREAQVSSLKFSFITTCLYFAVRKLLNVR